MGRLAFLMGLIGMTATSASMAADPAFCKSLCSTEQRTCRADAQLQPKEERFMPADTPDRNPYARTAQGEVAGQGAVALRANGDNNRRMDRTGACDATYARCTRACAAPSATQDKPLPPKDVDRAG